VITSHVPSLALCAIPAARVERSSCVLKLCTAWLIALAAPTPIWNIGSAKLISTTAMKSLGSNMRAVYWVKRPWPHMIRYEAHKAMRTSAASATSCTFGSKRWMAAAFTKSPPVSRSVVLRMNLNQTLSSSPTLSSSILARIRFGWTMV